jgi:hypothetical protein
MSLGRESVVQYARSIPGISRKDSLFAALNCTSLARAIERCDLLLSDMSSVPSGGARQVRMLRRLRTMIKLLGQQEQALEKSC